MFSNKNIESSNLVFDQNALGRIKDHVLQDINKEKYDGARILVAHKGNVTLDLTLGFADREKKQELKPDAIFSIMSISKVMTAIGLLRCVERGEISLLTPICHVIPEFAMRGKERVTVGQVITHMAGLGMAQPPMPIEDLGTLEKSIAVICQLPLDSSPGETVAYSAMTGFTILAEIVKRLDAKKRPFRKIMQDEVFEPLGMTDTSYGFNSAKASRRVPVIVRDSDAPELNRKFLADRDKAIKEDTELPSGGGTFSTAQDILRLGETLRLGGTYNGHQVLSPLMVHAMTQNQTGDKPNGMMVSSRALHGMAPFPAFLGLGVFVRGEGIFPGHMPFLGSPQTFGGWGLGSMAFWVDPVQEVTFVALTAGIVERIRSHIRFQIIGDMVLSSLVSK